jgi:hypothetical protein
MRVSGFELIPIGRSPCCRTMVSWRSQTAIVLPIGHRFRLWLPLFRCRIGLDFRNEARDFISARRGKVA